MFERYGDGATATTPQLGWSMTKSITATLVGLRHRATSGRQLGLGDRFSLPQWEAWEQHKAAKAAPKAAPKAGAAAAGYKPTVGDLLRMADGLDFDEDYVPPAPTLEMLFRAKATCDVMPRPVYRAAPGTCFHYSSLTSNLLQSALRESFVRTSTTTSTSTAAPTAEEYRAADLAYLAFPQQQLFAPLGIDAAALETDPTNTYVG